MYLLDSLLNTTLFKGILTTCFIFCFSLQLSKLYTLLAKVVYKKRCAYKQLLEILNIFISVVYCSFKTMCLQFAKFNRAVAKTFLKITFVKLLSNNFAKLRLYAKIKLSLVSFIISCYS